MSHTPNFDAKIKPILDALKPEERTCAFTGQKWLMDDEEIGWHKKFNVPPSKACPTARVTIVSCFATGFGWWYQKHPTTGEKLLTYVHPATGIKALPDPEFFDQDRTDKARDWNSSRPFFEQIRELQLEVPFTAWRSLTVPVNSVALLSQGDENSYFVTACRSKNSMYAYSCVDMESSAEVYESNNIVNSFSVLNSHRIHNGRFVRQCFDCINCSFVFDCRNCENCFGATNKRNRKFVWFNEQLSEEEWKKRRAAVDLGSRKVMQEMVGKFRELMATKTVWPENFNEQTENCIGEFLVKSRNCKYLFAGFDSSNCYYGCIHLGQNENQAYIGGATGSSNNFYCHAPLKSTGCKYVHSCYQCQNMEYCMQCYNCENCFGCVGLNRKKFCIFNKQYDESSYWQKVDEIKCAMLDRGEYGEFFPLSYSPTYIFASPGLIYLIDEETVTKLGAKLYNPDSAGALGEVSHALMKTPTDIPDHINDMDPEVWSKVVVFDKKEQRRFAFIKPELTLYKQLGIAPSNIHPMTRLKNMVFESNSALFVAAACAKCGKALIVSKNATYPARTIYCREDYLAYLEKNA